MCSYIDKKLKKNYIEGISSSFGVCIACSNFVVDFWNLGSDLDTAPNRDMLPPR